MQNSDLRNQNVIQNSKLSLSYYHDALGTMHSQSRRGFTLLEVLLASTIFTTVMIMAVGIFSANYRIISRVEAHRLTQQALRVPLEQLVRELRNADQVKEEGSRLKIVPDKESPNPANPDYFEYAWCDSSGQGWIARSKNQAATICDSSVERLTDLAVDIDDFRFDVKPDDPKAHETLIKYQPFVELQLKAVGEKDPQSGKAPVMTLKTIVVLRNFEKVYNP